MPFNNKEETNIYKVSLVRNNNRDFIAVILQRMRMEVASIASILQMWETTTEVAKWLS